MHDLKVEIPSGTYVIAVSGGVDSMVLLDLLAKRKDINLIVAHFDHGVRKESHKDRLLVQKTAQKYDLPFVYDKINLGPNVSEDAARKARYKFLNSAKVASGAEAIITAHHQDDVMETAIHNILRGTNRKGISSLKSTNEIIRPITHIDKKDLYAYAKNLGIDWNEDVTNQDISYKRNYIRHKILSRFNADDRQKLIEIIKNTEKLNSEIDQLVKEYLEKHSNGKELNRHSFIILPHSVAVEIMASWLRHNGIRDFDSKLLDKLTIGAKTLASGQRLDINLRYFLEINRINLALIDREC